MLIMHHLVDDVCVFLVAQAIPSGGQTCFSVMSLEAPPCSFPDNCAWWWNNQLLSNDHFFSHFFL